MIGVAHIASSCWPPAHTSTLFYIFKLVVFRSNQTFHSSLWSFCLRSFCQVHKYCTILIYLVDRLSHVVLFHRNVVANQLLHRCAQQAVFQKLLHILLMLWVLKCRKKKLIHILDFRRIKQILSSTSQNGICVWITSSYKTTWRGALSIPNFKVGQHAAT